MNMIRVLFAFFFLTSCAFAGGVPSSAPASSPWIEDGSGGAEIQGSVTVGGTNPLSVDTDGDGDADFILGTAAPAAADSTGVAGTVFFADDFIYYCIATDTWVRTALATWP